jgi:hypothetical protein
MSHRSATARTKLLGLPQFLARVVLGATEEQAIGHLKDAVEQIASENKPFDAADFRAKEIQERSEPEEPDAPDTGKVSG